MRLHKGSLGVQTFYQTNLVGSEYNYFTGTVDDSWAGLSALADTLYAFPIYFGRNFRVKQYGVMVSAVSVGGANIDFGIYTDNLNKVGQSTPTGRLHYPWKLLSATLGSQDNVTVAGFKSKTFTTPLLLRGDRLYWCVFKKDANGTLTVVCSSKTWTHYFGMYNTDALERYYKGISMYQTGELPSLWPAGLNWEISIPMFFFRETDGGGS